MGSNGFPPDWPAGLRVLVVDDETTWSKQLQHLLKKSKYEVCKCSSTTEARKKLKGNFEIVMCNPNMESSGGFSFLKFVARELDVPVIMMSRNGSVSNVKKGIEFGACHYLLKPITFKDVEHIWQHAYRKKEPQIEGEGEGDEGSESGLAVAKIKGELSDINNHGGNCFETDSSSKKTRAVWTDELNALFEKAVAQIESIPGGRVGPKRILELMNEAKPTNLTREQVASHLQKHRSKKNNNRAQEIGDTNINPPHQMIDEAKNPLTREQIETVTGPVVPFSQVYSITNPYHQQQQQQQMLIHHNRQQQQQQMLIHHNRQQQQQQQTRSILQNRPQQEMRMGMDGYNNYPPCLIANNINFNPIQDLINRQPTHGYPFDQSFFHHQDSGGFNHPIGNTDDDILLSIKNEQNARAFIPQNHNPNPMFNAPQNQNPMFNAPQNLPNSSPNPPPPQQNQNQNPMFNAPQNLPNFASTSQNLPKLDGFVGDDDRDLGHTASLPPGDVFP